MNAVNGSQTAVAAGLNITPVILVIDDNTALRRALNNIFTTSLNIAVCGAANGYEGVQLYQQKKQSVVLVLLDMNMPVMNGEQTYDKLRQIAPQLRVIISSSLSWTEASHRLGAHRLGEQKRLAFLRKPYGMQQLLTVVQAELTAVQATNQFGSFINNRPQNGRSVYANGVS